MEADSVYSELNGKISDINYKFSDISSAISDLKSRLQDNSSRFDALRSDLNDLKSSVIDMKSSSSGDLKGAMDKLTSDIQRINDTLSTMKTGVDEAKQTAITRAKEVEDKAKYDWEATEKKITAANEASEKKYQEQAGFFLKLNKQAEDAVNMFAEFPNTIKSMATKAVDDGKKEILNIWDNSKRDMMDGMSSLVTGFIKDHVKAAKDEMKEEMKEFFYDEVRKEKADDKPGPLAKMDKAELDEMIEKAVKLAIANTRA